MFNEIREKTRKDAYELLLTTMYGGEGVINQVTFYKWYIAFEIGRESIIHEPGEERSSTFHAEVVTRTLTRFHCVMTMRGIT